MIADYHDKTREFPVLPDVRPGYLSKLLPTEAPDHPESWESICKDFDTAILPGMTHFNSPNFYAYEYFIFLHFITFLLYLSNKMGYYY